jgi:UDP-N-acetylmuramoyl-tripeptide--D-alanyl-D-alanine ligase
MERLSLSDIVRAVEGRLHRGQDCRVCGVSIDSRTAKPGDIYFAIRGKRLDGHAFVAEALAAGAVGVVLSRTDALPKSGAAVLVDDTTLALGRLAGFYRKKMSCRAVAVTGSNGKTTTKELLAALLGTRYRTLKPESSFNNDIGVPLTVLRLDQSTEAAVFEIEMNELGGTERLGLICQPQVGVVTNVGDTHLEFMRDRRGVAAEKCELVRVLPRDGTAVLNADDPLVAAMAGQTQAASLTFGLECRADVTADSVVDRGLDGLEFRLQGRYAASLPMPGRHNLLNCLAACAAASALGIEFEAMVPVIRASAPLPLRLRVQRFGIVTLIEDCYNANPQSMLAALQVLKQSAQRESRVAFLGDMLELGDVAEASHEALGRAAGGIVDRLGLVGSNGAAVERGARSAGLRAVLRFSSSEDARRAAFDLVRPGDTILVKGSRAMKMELVSQEITAHYEYCQGRSDREG